MKKDSEVIDAEVIDEQSEETKKSRFSRRQLIGAATGLAGALLIAGAALKLRSGDSIVPE